MKISCLFFGIVFGFLIFGFIGFGFYNTQAKVLSASKDNEKVLEVVEGITNFVNHYYQDFIPYEVTKGQIIIDKTQYVRNIATMYDIMQLQSHFYPNKTKVHGIDARVINQIHENAEFYLGIYKKNPLVMRQASAFLALLLSMISQEKYQHDIGQITDFLYEQIDDLEPQFELGEVLMALGVLDPKLTILNSQINKIIKSIEKNGPKIDKIFQYNWLSKFIVTYKNEYSRKLAVILYEKVRGVMRLFTYEEETNYLAVAYECLAALRAYDNTLDVAKLIKKTTEALFNRYNLEYGLFAFKNGDMRFDITGHVLNGFMY